MSVHNNAICLVACLAALCAASVVPMPPTFDVRFQEITYTHNVSMPGGIGKVYAKSDGRWTYDWPRHRWIFDHGPGDDPFCSTNDPSQQGCRVHFSNSSEMIVQYKNGTCCALCGAGEGCTMLTPDWLTRGGGTPARQPDERVNGKVCSGYGRPGSQTIVDAWFTTPSGEPCAYFESYHFPPPLGEYFHNISFDLSTYTTDPLPDAFFEVPQQCQTPCPQRFPSTIVV